MSNLFCIIGEPEKRDEKTLEVIRESGLEALHLSPTSSALYNLRDVAPLAVLIGSEVEDRRNLVDHLKAQETMLTVPLIAQLPSPDVELVNSAFKDGVDEILVDGSFRQLAVMSEVLQNRTIKLARQTAGTVLVADPNRQSRVRFAHALKRGGFDVHFAADCQELEKSIESISPRAIIAAPHLPGGSFYEILESAGLDGRGSRPWIVVSSKTERNTVLGQFANSDLVTFVNDGDAIENISFKINELLNPVPAGRRNSRRLLYGTPVHFEFAREQGPFFGYCYNVNLNGLFIRTLTAPEYGTELELKFSPPFGRGYIAVTAQVTWRSVVAEKNGKITPPGMGVQFLEWNLADWAGFEAGYGALLAAAECSRPVYWDRPKSVPPISLPSHQTPTYQPAYL